jgi:hypothetical protein
VALVRERTIPTERPPLVGEVSVLNIKNIKHLEELLRGAALLITLIEVLKFTAFDT